MFMGKPSVNRGKITSTDNTHPTSQNAKQIPDQHNAQNKRHIAERFSAWAVCRHSLRARDCNA
jgi:hypothetical protein